MDRPTVYVETSIISYLTAKPSRDVVLAGNQALTQEWWTRVRHRFALFASALVEQEAARGDPQAAAKRLAYVRALPQLEILAEAVHLARTMVVRGALPRAAEVDALHIAMAAVHGVEYLITWNCRHIANATARRQIEHLCREQGLEPPLLCTPQELPGIDP